MGRLKLIIWRDVKYLYLERWRRVVPGEVEKTCTWRGGEDLYLERWRRLVPEEV